MFIKKNKFYQNILFLVITLMVIFNGGNSDLFIQFNFIIISIFFLLLIREKNYLAHVKNIFSKNKLSLKFYILFLSFLLFQIIPLPKEWLSFFSTEKYYILEKLEFEVNYNYISLSPVKSYFSLLNYLTLFLYLIIFKILFHKKKNIFNFYFFLASLGAFASSVAVYFYLIGNPDFWIIKNELIKSAATGFFINRTVFSCFLVLCFFSGMEYLRIIDNFRKNDPNNFFNKIYIRIFLLFITIGIITSFSKLGNFLFITLIICYIFYAIYINGKKNKFFLISLLLIILFDILIVGFYFGSEKLIYRYSFLQNEINEYSLSSVVDNFNRGALAKFAFVEFKKFILFGYGSGGFEYLFKINFENLSTNYASHSHSDLIEYMGEFGLIGFTLISLCLFFSCNNKRFFTFKNILLCYLLIFILAFDFSFHIPIIQLIFILLLSASYEGNKNYE